MKKIVFILNLTFSYIVASAQCTPNSLYQDSLFDIWPDTIQNLPHTTQGINYYTQIDLKTPATLIEAAAGDSSLTTIDTLGNSYYIGAWPVDSMSMISTIGLPNGLSLDCNTPGCTFPGDIVGCGNIYGTTNDPVGIYPITIAVNVFTHGSITFLGFPIAVETDLYTATGDYDYIEGYKIIVNSSTGLETFHQNDFVLFQNIPNPFTHKTSFLFNSPKESDIAFTITDMFGRTVFTKNIKSKIGINTINFENNLSTGLYIYSINNGEIRISERMIISDRQCLLN